MKDLYFISITISLFCVGLRIISSPGMILYFLRRGYDQKSGELAKKRQLLSIKNKWVSNHNSFVTRLRSGERPFPKKQNGEEMDELQKHDYLIQATEDLREGMIEVETIEKRVKKLNILTHILKPIVGCGTCMASFWSIILFPVMYFLVFTRFPSYYEIGLLPVIMFISAGFNSIIIAMYDFLIKRSKCKNCN